MRIDWPAIIKDMQACGMSMNQQAVEVNVTYSTLQGWAEGSSPRYETGYWLIELHRTVCGSSLTDLRLKAFYEDY